MKHLDLLELELRRLPSVAFVAFQQRSDVLVVQVMGVGHAEPEALRGSAERVCRAHLDVPFAVELAGASRPSRIRLLDVAVRPAEFPAAGSPEPVPGIAGRRPCGAADGVEVEVHLGYEGVHTVGRAAGCDPSAAASATFEALQRLGAQVPFRVDAAALFEHVLGEGVMLVLGSDTAGERYGVAAGRTVEQAAVRATLHALNRYLSTQTLPALAG